jgi:hypothetical protein
MIEINKYFNLMLHKLDLWIKQLVLMLPNLIIALLVLILTFFAARVIQKTVDKILPRFSHSLALNNLVSSLVYTIAILIGFFFVLSILQLDKTVTTYWRGPVLLVWPWVLPFRILPLILFRGLLLRYANLSG